MPKLTMRLAKLLNVTDAEVGWVPSGLFCAVLESVAILCWFLVLQPNASRVTQSVMQLVTDATKVTNLGNINDAQPLSELDSKVEELIRDVKADRLRLTVDSVMNYYSCARNKAAKLNRLAKDKLNAESQTC